MEKNTTTTALNINQRLLLRYTNFEYLLFKKNFGNHFPKKTLKAMFLNSDLKYIKSIIQNYWETLYNLLISSTKTDPCPVIEELFINFLELINDNSHAFQHKNSHRKCLPKKDTKADENLFDKKASDFHIQDSPMVNDRFNPDNPKDKQFICSMYTLLKTSLKTSAEVKKPKIEKKEMKQGIQEVNDFVTQLVIFDKKISSKWAEVKPPLRNFFIIFIFAVLYKDKYYNLFVNKSSNIKKIGFLWKNFETLRNDNKEIILFKYLRNAIPKKIEEKLCRANPKLSAILNALKNEDQGRVRFAS